MFRMKFGSRINAIQVGAILERHNNNVSSNTVLLGIAAEINFNHFEARALDLYLQKNKALKLHSTGDNRKSFPVETWLCAEPYGLINEDGVILLKLSKNDLTKNDYARLQIDLYCTDRDWCDCIFYWLDNDGSEQFIVNRIERDSQWLLANLPKLKKSWDQAAALNPNSIENPNKDIRITERTDDEWLMYSNWYKDILTNLEHYEQEKERVRQFLIMLADNKPASGNGVRLSTSVIDNLTKYIELMNLLCTKIDTAYWASLTVEKANTEAAQNSNLGT